MTTAAPPATAAPLAHRRVMLVLVALMLGMFLASLDQTVVSTALPTIVGDLHGASHLTWVVTAYLLSSTVSTPLWGKLGDQYGRKAFFQASIVIFLFGSALSGLSHSMLELIVFRALQGLGGGGLMIGAQTIIGDVVSPRERGRYMGMFYAMFGVTTVIGPLIGGLFVDYLSWRWIFYVNIPIGVVALFVTATSVPGALSRVHRVIDYAGTVVLSLAATALVLFTSLGGTSYPWGSPIIVALAAGGVALTVLFVVAERRAAEPVVPLALFRNRVFSASSAIGFVLGFAMFGALTFLPLFLQVAKGVSPTVSGVWLFPMMGGVLVASLGSGQLVARRGRYKVFPVVGGALMTLGLYLISLVGPATSELAMGGAMLVFGLGLGFVMQVLVVAVQNAVPYEQLGVATSGATFFRMIGGSFGAAVFGAIFSNLLGGNLARYLHGVRVPASMIAQADNPKILATLPAPARHGVVLAISHTVDTLFLIGVPIAFVAFVLSWLLPEIELRRSVRTTEPGESLAMPEGRTSLQELRHQLDRIAVRENRQELYRTLAARAGLALAPSACWLLYRLAERPVASLVGLAAELKVDPARLEPALAELEGAGLVTSADGGQLDLTAAGVAAAGALAEARRASLTEVLEGWDPEEHPEVLEMVRQLAHQLLADDARLLADARRGAAAAR
ncbi:MAG: MDR family MFS transporter [Acidimicrobiales bacterium]